MSKYRIREYNEKFTVEKYENNKKTVPCRTFLGITIKSRQIEVHEWTDRFDYTSYFGNGYTYRNIDTAKRKIDELINFESVGNSEPIYHYYPKENNS